MGGLGAIPAQRMLHVQIVALAFRPGHEANRTYETALALDPTALCVAIVARDHAPTIKADWHDEPNRRLIIASATSQEAPEVATDLINTLPPGPLAVLLANAPEAKGLRSLIPSKAGAVLVERLLKLRTDIQVVPYSPSWPHRLPRIR